MVAWYFTTRGAGVCAPTGTASPIAAAAHTVPRRVMGRISEDHAHADLELARRRGGVGRLAERGARALQRPALWRAFGAAGVQRADEGFGIEVRMVDHVEHVHGGDEAHLLADLDGTREAQVPDVGGVGA